MRALDEARTKNQETSEAMRERGQQICARTEEHAQLLARFGDIGRAAAEASAEVRELGSSPTAKDDKVATVEVLRRIEERMRKIVDDAQALGKDAQASGLGDLAQQADALRQQVASARNKVGLVAAKLQPS